MPIYFKTNSFGVLSNGDNLDDLTKYSQNNYYANLHMGKIFRWNKLKFYSEIGGGFSQIRNLIYNNINKTYDVSNTLIKESYYYKKSPTVNKFSLYFSEGLYYSFCKKMDIGLDMNCNLLLYSVNGIEYYRTSNYDKDHAFFSEKNYSSYSSGQTLYIDFIPSFSIRYQF